ncbi:MAG: hypothetical protein ACREBI_10460 [Nitrosotalea sp.]
MEFDLIWSIILTSVGGGILFAFFSSVRLRELRKKFVEKHGLKTKGSTIYDNLDNTQLEKVISKMSTSCAVLITVFAILLAFVVTERISLALTNLYFVIWCGWIIAIIVKLGLISVDLFDLLETKKDIRRTLFFYKDVLRNTPLLLIPIIAVMPIFFLEPIPTMDSFKNLPWSFETEIFSGVLAIIGAVAVTYYMAFQNKDVSAQFAGMWGNNIFFVLVGIFNYSKISPTIPEKIILFNQTYQIPLVIQFLSVAGIVFGLFMILYLFTALWMVRLKQDQISNQS